MFAWIDNLLCGTDKLLLLSPLNIHSSLLSRSCPWKCCILPTDASVRYFVWSWNCCHKAKYLEDMRVKFLMALVREHSAPANNEILSEGVIGGNVENLDQHLHEQCCPLWQWQSLLCQRWRTTRVVREGGNSAAHDLNVVKRLGFSGIGVTLVLPIGIWNKIVCKKSVQIYYNLAWSPWT